MTGNHLVQFGVFKVCWHANLQCFLELWAFRGKLKIERERKEVSDKIHLFCFFGFIFYFLGEVARRATSHHLTIPFLVFLLLVCLLFLRGLGFGRFRVRALPHLTLSFCFSLLFLVWNTPKWPFSCNFRDFGCLFTQNPFSKSFFLSCSSFLLPFQNSIFAFSFLQHPLFWKQCCSFLSFFLNISFFCCLFLSYICCLLSQMLPKHPIFKSMSCLCYPIFVFVVLVLFGLLLVFVFLKQPLFGSS